jgi:hypothetical protein
VLTLLEKMCVRVRDFTLTAKAAVIFLGSGPYTKLAAFPTVNFMISGSSREKSNY